MKKRPYENAKHYISEIRKNHDLCLIPIKLVAEYLGVEPQTVNGYANNDSLIKVGIDGGRISGIELGSLIEMEKKEEEKINKKVIPARKFLVKSAQQGRLIEYGKLMEKINLDHQKAGDRKLLGKVLFAISRESMRVDKLMISAIAVRKMGKRPNDSFYVMAEREGFWKTDNAKNEKKRKKFFEKEVMKIEKKYKSEFVEVWEG